ncbi:MAG: hypothetical protein LBS38_03650 [Endomicrobium sp.]|jgi:hypothetical protein|nr:hypothetical protein [Endomicrobium sp.]MDR2399276.1 hypothetical protein [Endomicrobium sp.]
MKKISKKICALVLVFGLLFAPMKYASADFDASKVDYNYVGQQVTSLSSIFADVFNVFGYTGAASFVSAWTPQVINFLKGLSLFFNMYNSFGEMNRAAQSPYEMD